LLTRVNGETYAVPMTHVSETVHVDAAAVRSVKGHEVMVMRKEVLPLVSFRDLVRLPRANGHRRQVIVLELGDRRAGLVVDELTGQQDIVVKQFDAVREGVSLFSGATILADGAPALIVDVGSLL
ncbi:MAG: chemotaxis protein CheW, partial [Gemmatimonadaceae bacterium]